MDWGSWLLDGASDGAGRAHQVAVDPVARRPTTTLSKFGSVVSDPGELLRTESGSLETFGRPLPETLGSRVSLTCPSLISLLLTSRWFSRNAAVGLD
eukprot:1454108-Pyramimonas_sp.AAC.1